jgi:hypothetical protein
MDSKLPKPFKLHVQQYVKWIKQPDGSYIESPVNREGVARRIRHPDGTYSKLPVNPVNNVGKGVTADIKTSDPRVSHPVRRRRGPPRIIPFKLGNQNLNPQNSLLG